MELLGEFGLTAPLNSTVHHCQTTPGSSSLMPPRKKTAIEEFNQYFANFNHLLRITLKNRQSLK